MSDGIDAQSALVADMAKHWPMITALVSGTAAMRAAGEKFMPKWPYESKESFDARLKTATLFSAFSRTCAVMSNKPFARPLAIDENKISESLKPLLSDIDMFGTDLQPFCANLFLACMQYGLVGVLVDSPPSKGAKSRADEKEAGIRPYLSTYAASSILGWRSERNADGSHLTQLRLLESVSEPDGRFGDKAIAQIRVLEPGKWETWRKVETSEVGKPQWILHESGVTSIQRIPFVFFYGLRAGFGVGHPPLIDLAFLNVEHWQSSSDQQTILHVARIPVLFAKGFGEQDEIVIGASMATKASKADADLRYVEHSGAAVDAGRQSLLDIEDRMRQLGAELLVKRQSRNTATEVKQESEGNKSALQKIVEDFEESIEDCLALMGEWIGEPTDIEVGLYKDFDAGDISDLTGDLLLRATEAGLVSHETAFSELKRIDVVHPDVQWTDEKTRIAADPKPDESTLVQKG